MLHYTWLERLAMDMNISLLGPLLKIGHPQQVNIAIFALSFHFLLILKVRFETHAKIHLITMEEHRLDIYSRWKSFVLHRYLIITLLNSAFLDFWYVLSQILLLAFIDILLWMHLITMELWRLKYSCDLHRYLIFPLPLFLSVCIFGI